MFLKKAFNLQQTLNKLNVFFAQIQYYTDTCVTIEMIRTDLVAKTKPAAIKVYDYYDPGRFNFSALIMGE